MTDNPGPRGILITGGAAGIGWATAQRFARGGDRVAILDRDVEAAAARAAQLGAGHVAITADVANEDQLVDAVHTANDALGGLDVLINNAAILDPAGSAPLDMPIDVYRKLLAVNVAGPFVASREALSIMEAAGCGGAIVNVASLAGMVAVPNSAAYSSTKAAVIGLTRAMARECLSSGVRVNAVVPGHVSTEMVRAIEGTGRYEPSLIDRRIPMGRRADPIEIANVIHHLASAEASFTVGANVTVDGGFQAFGGSGHASDGVGRGFAGREGPRAAIVTGAASEIAAAVAARLAAQNVKLLLIDADANALLQRGRELGGGTLTMAGDIANEKFARQAVEAIVKRFGSLDLLVVGCVNNVVSPLLPTLERFCTMTDTPLLGAMIMACAAAPAMPTSGGGAIVYLSPMATLSSTLDRRAHEALSAGIGSLTRSLACDWARLGIRVNMVSYDPRVITSRALHHPGRTGICALSSDARAIAAAVDFVGSPGASYMTGAVYLADGGWTVGAIRSRADRA